MARVVAKTKKAAPALPAKKPFMEPHELVLSPTIQGAAGIQAWSKFMGEADLRGLITELRERTEKVQSGDMKSVEAMLYGQAMTLQTIFTHLARRATSHEYLNQFQATLGLAFKAQAQCRATLEALAEIKNPRPVAFVRQANISSGHQQVNNGPAAQTGTVRTGAHAHAGQTGGLQNGLLEDDSKPKERSAPKEVHPAEMR